MPRPEKHIFICTQQRPEGHPKGCCTSRGGPAVMNALMEEIDRHGLYPKVVVTRTGCLGPCSEGPNMIVYPESVMYNHLTPEDAKEIVEQHLVNNKPVKRLMAPPELW